MGIGWPNVPVFQVVAVKEQPAWKRSLNIREAIQAYIAALEEDLLPVPEDRFEAIVVAV